MRKCTGLHNRNRTGRSTYSLLSKSRDADRYGQFANGRQLTADVIAGRQVKIPERKEERG